MAHHTRKEMTKLTRCILRSLPRYKNVDDEIDYGGLLNETILLIDKLELSPSQLGQIASHGKGLSEHHRAEPKRNVPFICEYFDIKIWINSRDSGLLLIKKIAAITAIVHALTVQQKVCK